MDEKRLVDGTTALAEKQPRVIKIEPAERPQNVRLRVAAYTRVSSDSEDQLNSFAAQNRYYTELISSKAEWRMVDIYADEGITGTSVAKRDDFQRMMADCRRGLIDQILVKSISRFARNTKDCLQNIRELKERGVNVRFEREGIDTVNVSSELITAIYAAFAQKESESISGNMRWSYQRRMESGTFLPSSMAYGYRLDGKKIVIDPEAALIRSIGRWTMLSRTALPPALLSWKTATMRQTRSQISCRRSRREHIITTGCSAITTTTGPLMKSTYCSGIRSYKLSETGQGREKHGDVTVLFSALSVESGAVRRKGETMNIRKAVDYSTMFATLESIMKADLPQMELYCEIGKAVCAHSEKGAAVAAAEFIKEQYPDMTGFSPRNVRRMRDFWQLYSGTPELLGEALHLNWTQNIVIMEAELPAEERRWYIRQATARNLSKAELLRMIEDSAYLESVLDEKVDVWYNEGNDEISERTQYEEDPVYLSWQYLPQPHGRVRDEGLGKKGGTGIAISYRISGYQSGGDRQPCLSSGTAQAGRAWNLLRRPCRTAVDESGLRRIRSPDRHGPGQPPGYVPHLRRRLCRKDVPPDGPHRSSRQCGRPVVHRGLRGDLAGCAGWLPRTYERIHDRTR